MREPKRDYVARSIFDVWGFISKDEAGLLYEPTWENLPDSQRRQVYGGADAAIAAIERFEPAPPTPLQVGDVVRLRSGGPRMTVTHVADPGTINDTEVRWFSGGDMELADFPPDALVRVIGDE